MIFFSNRIPTNSVEKYKITPCDSANAFGGTIPNNIGTNSATNDSGGGTGGNFFYVNLIISTLIVTYFTHD